MTRTATFSLGSVAILLLVTTGCATTTGSSPVLTKDLAAVAVGAMLIPAKADMIAGDAIWQRPDQAAEITEVAMTSAPDQKTQIRSAAILAAPDRIDQILAAQARVDRRPLPSTRIVIPEPSDVVDLVTRTNR